MKSPKCKDIPSEFWYPKGATEDIFKVYRLTINKDSVCSDDFLSNYELDKKNNRVRADLKGFDIYYGISTFEDIEDAIKFLEKIKAKKHLAGFAEGYTAEGLVRKTPRVGNSHVTWWPFDYANPETQFVTIPKGDENE